MEANHEAFVAFDVAKLKHAVSLRMLFMPGSILARYECSF